MLAWAGALALFVASEEECCWCGKPYHRDRPAQTAAAAADSAAGHPTPHLVIDGQLGPVDVRTDKGFYVPEVDEEAALVAVVLHPPAERQLAMTLSLDGDEARPLRPSSPCCWLPSLTCWRCRVFAG